MDDPAQRRTKPQKPDSGRPAEPAGQSFRADWFPLWCTVHLIITPALIFSALVSRRAAEYAIITGRMDTRLAANGIAVMLFFGALHAFVAVKNRDERMKVVSACATIQLLVYGVLLFGTCCLHAS